MFNKFFSVFLLAQLLLSLSPGFSQTVIGLGTKDDEIGVLRSYGEHWKPLFFAVDKEGQVHIPDFYKNRIVVYSSQGRFQKAIPVQQGLSPRMNVFLRNTAGQYLSLTDGSLFVLDPQGKVLWQKGLGMAFFPQQILFSDESVQVLSTGSRGRVFRFRASDGTPLPFLDHPLGEERTLPLFALGNQRFTYYLRNMPLLRPDWEVDESLRNYRLFALQGNGNSLWMELMDLSNSKWVLQLNPQGKEVKRTFVSDPSSFAGSGVMTIIGEQGGIYQAAFTDESMQILKVQ